MRVLLDENVPIQLARELHGHEVRHVVRTSLAGLKNGQLLRSAAGQYDVLITMDRNIPEQQRLPESLALVIVRVRSGRVQEVLDLAPQVNEVLSRISPGETATIVPTS